MRINRKKAQFMKNAYSEGEGMELEGSPIAKTPSYLVADEADLKKLTTWQREITTDDQIKVPERSAEL
ncbi:hypothetical protein OESDEN_10318 [Oesophagostomum dentatum]|uniref:Uncharacterized protein n=1 Tax=Oesophagostomum dentatum TaxID=61180 RepID=A0A0B1SX12_OESDE|nr:hypothetical protein OESDEN_10318 [Oesophagostomum dentatum]